MDLTKGNLLAILDIEEEKRDKYTIIESGASSTMAWLDQCPQEDADEELTPLASVSWEGDLVTIFATSAGEAVMVPQRQIAPADGREPLVFALRRGINQDTGEIFAPRLVCFRDMLANAIIMPIRAEVAQDIWRLMRKSCAEGLRYCMEEKGEEAAGT